MLLFCLGFTCLWLTAIFVTVLIVTSPGSSIKEKQASRGIQELNCTSFLQLGRFDIHFENSAEMFDYWLHKIQSMDKNATHIEDSKGYFKRKTYVMMMHTQEDFYGRLTSSNLLAWLCLLPD